MSSMGSSSKSCGEAWRSNPTDEGGWGTNASISAEGGAKCRLLRNSNTHQGGIIDFDTVKVALSSCVCKFYKYAFENEFASHFKALLIRETKINGRLCK